LFFSVLGKGVQAQAHHCKRGGEVGHGRGGRGRGEMKRGRGEDEAR